MFVSLVAAVLAASAPAEVPAEADTVAQLAADRVAIGAPVSGTLEAGDATLQTGEYADYYVVSGRAGQRVAITVSSQQFDTYVFIRGAGLSADNDDVSASVRDSRLEVTFPSNGDFTIAVTSYQPGEIGNYQMAISDLGAGAPPVANTAAQPAVAGTGDVAGRLEAGDFTLPSGEFVDAFPYQGRAGDRLRLRLTSNDFDTWLGLFGPGGFQTANDDAPGMGTNSMLDVVLPADGEYTIQVTSYQPGETGAYVLSSGDAPGSGQIAFAPLTSGQTIQDALQAGDAQLNTGEYADYFSYQGTAGEVLTIDQTSTAIDPYLFIRGPGSFAIDNDDRAQGDLNAQLAVTLPATGEYHIVATSYQPGETGAYTLTFRSGGAATTAGAPLQAGTAVSGNLGPGGGMRPTGQFTSSHTFEGRAGERVVLDLTSGAFDTYLTLRMPNGWEETNDDISANDFNSRLALTLPADGTYTAVASSYRAGDIGPYTLRLTTSEPAGVVATQPVGGTAPVPSAALALGSSVDGALEPSDRQLNTGEYFDVHTFDAAAGTTMTLTLESDAVDTYVIVRGPGGFEIENDDGVGVGLNSRVEFTAPADGTYSVVATTYAAGELGAYRVSLVEGTAAQNAGRGRIYAVLAGISNYGGAASDLPYCAEDAIKLQQSLAGTGLLAPESVLLTDGQVTRGALESAFRNIGSQITPDDVFIFFYSGHGAQVSGAEMDGQDETLYVIDGNVTDDEVAAWFDGIDARISMVALDSCFSGGFARDVISQPGRMGVFSSEEDVLSNVANRFNAGGYLSYFLRDAFEGLSDVDPADGVITAGELTQYLRREWADHMMNERVETGDTEPTYQNLVVDRGAVKVSDVLVYPARN